MTPRVALPGSALSPPGGRRESSSSIDEALDLLDGVVAPGLRPPRVEPPHPDPESGKPNPAAPVSSCDNPNLRGDCLART
jgi:hypothetical protein